MECGSADRVGALLNDSDALLHWAAGANHRDAPLAGGPGPRLLLHPRPEESGQSTGAAEQTATSSSVWCSPGTGRHAGLTGPNCARVTAMPDFTGCLRAPSPVCGNEGPSQARVAPQLDGDWLKAPSAPAGFGEEARPPVPAGARSGRACLRDLGVTVLPGSHGCLFPTAGARAPPPEHAWPACPSARPPDWASGGST